MSDVVPLALRVRELAYRYDDGRLALEDVSFSLGATESLGVIGPNGAGKTTLFLAVTGIHRPTAGDIDLFGTAGSSRNGTHLPVDLRRRIGLVFQETDEQLFSATVFDDVAFGPLNFGFSRDEIDTHVERALRAVDLAGYEKRCPQHLSAGEKRRVAIATAIAYEPDILVLDEPTSDLDPRGRRQLVKLVRGMKHAKMIASHDLDFVRATCDRVIVLEGGRVRASGQCEEILDDRELLERHGL